MTLNAGDTDHAWALESKGLNIEQTMSIEDSRNQ
jgi:hypothetical protein